MVNLKSKFAVFNRSWSPVFTASGRNYASENTNNYDDINIEDYYSTHFNLSASPNTLDISEKGRIKFTVTADEDIPGNVYMVINS